MNGWQTLFFAALFFGVGYGAKGCAEQRGRTETFTALHNQMLTYNAQTIAAQKENTDRVLSAVADIRQPPDINNILEEVQLAPESNLCINSPAIALVFERLRALQKERAPAASSDLEP